VDEGKIEERNIATTLILTNPSVNNWKCSNYGVGIQISIWTNDCIDPINDIPITVSTYNKI
jgi:hypothetical protein